MASAQLLLVIVCHVLSIFLSIQANQAQPLDILSQKPQITAMDWRPDGQQFALGLGTVIQIWDAAAFQPTITFPIAVRVEALFLMSISSIDWNATSDKIAVSVNNQGNNAFIQVFEASTGQLVAEYEADNQSFSVAWSPDGNFLAGVAVQGVGPSARNEIRVWDTTTNELVARLKRESYKDLIVALAWNPDGSRLASGSLDQTVTIWDTTTWKALFTLFRPEMVFSLSWSPDGRQLAVGSSESSIRIWDPVTGHELTGWTIDDSGIFDLAWQPDGTLLAIAAGTSLQIWDISRGEPVTIIPIPHQYFLYQYLAWRPDGCQLLYGGSTMTEPAVKNVPCQQPPSS